MVTATDDLLEVTRDMLLIHSLDWNAHIQLDINGKWFVSAMIDIDEDGTCRSVGEHTDTPNSAVSVFVRKLKALTGVQLVHVYGANERYYRWNGVAFAERQK